jgi:2''-5'' RNA ligase
MNKRITLITNFENEISYKIDKLIKNTGISTCKVPYGVEGVDDRIKMDTLPYHLTICTWNETEKELVIDFLNSISFQSLTVYVNNVELMDGRNNSKVLYLSIEKNEKLISLQKKLYEKFENSKYNPDNFVFHITLDIDQDTQKILKLEKEIKKLFVPFKIEITSIGLYEIYPAIQIHNIKS